MATKKPKYKMYNNKWKPRSFRLSDELLRKLAEIANREHRSIAAQGVLFLEGSVESYWRMVMK